MRTHTTGTPGPSGAGGAVVPGAMNRAVAAARAAVEDAAAVPTGHLDRFELQEVVAEATALVAQATALQLAVLAEADARQVAEETAATGTDAWAARLTGSTRAVMAGGIWLAGLLREKYDATREAFAAGSLSVDQVRAIVRAAEKIPARVPDAHRRAAEAELVAIAVDGADARRLRQAGRRILESFSRQLADQCEADQLEAEEEATETRTWLTLADQDDGTVRGRFEIPELHAHLLRAHLERLTAPRRWGRNRAGNLVDDPTLGTDGETLPYPEKLGAGLLELLEHLPTSGHHGNTATVLVHIDHQHLLDGLASARLDTGTRISASQARRLACEAAILPAVLGGASHILDLGRRSRLHTGPQRDALSLQHDTCAAEGCERPFAWCEIHHPHPWSAGGPTDLTNALPLCAHHHRRAHDRRYTMRVLPTGEARFSYRRRSQRATAA